MKILVAFILGLVLTTKTAFAHGAVSYGGGFINGILHPIFGLDHLLAMIAVGIVSVQLKKYTNSKSIYGVPILFVSSMVIGGLLGMFGFIELPGIETAIKISVILLGVFMLFENLSLSKISIFVYLSVSFFGVYHGFAHGLEVPQMVVPMLYVAGFAVATVCIHILGIIIGKLSEKKKFFGTSITNILGATFVAIGILLFLM